jgi:hypothetical protein
VSQISPFGQRVARLSLPLLRAFPATGSLDLDIVGIDISVVKDTSGCSDRRYLSPKDARHWQ